MSPSNEEKKEENPSWLSEMNPIPELEKSVNKRINPDQKWSLKNLDQVPEEYVDATKVVIEELENNKEVPSEFHTELEIRPDGMLVFHLWHESAFTAINEAEKQGEAILGNPGGRCRDYIFDPTKNKIVNKWMWQ